MSYDSLSQKDSSVSTSGPVFALAIHGGAGTILKKNMPPEKDKQGNLAAATSTGGLLNKRYGRIWDSPIIGAGTYANNKTCAVSCTGHGEYFIRLAVAHDISALMEYKNLILREAAGELIHVYHR